jgi:predicted AAA+ superfamily ATPase
MNFAKLTANTRTIEKDLMDVADYKKAIVVTGLHQVGKTTLIKTIASGMDSSYLYINGDHTDAQKDWNRPTFTNIKRMPGNHRVVVFDEAQRLNDIGLTVKQIVDDGKNIQVFVSGSSALDMANRLNESLTRLKWTYNLNPLSHNQRNEITGKRKIYFYANGIRNRLINNLEPLHARNDVGALWENFIMRERLKQLSYNHYYGASYFWRTHNDSEVDYIEEIDGNIHAYEFKWNPKAKGKISRSFINTYSPAEAKTITRDNFYEWLETYPYRK